MEEKEFIIRDLLNELRISRDHKGYYYVLYAMILLEEHEELLVHLTKGLYQKIGDYYGVNALAVERNIRTVKYIAWDRFKDEELFLGYTSCPSNGAFLDLLLAEVQKRLFENGLTKSCFGTEMKLF